MSEPDLLRVDGVRAWCLRCRRPGSVCLCDQITVLTPRTRFVFLMHPKEDRKIKNGTGRLAHLSLAGSELHIGVDFREHARVNALIADPRLACRLLYPRASGASDEPAGELADDRLPVLFVLDGTWACAKKMMRLSTNLHGLPRLSIDVDRPSGFRTKYQPDPACLGTIEAVDRTLLALGREGLEDWGPAESEALLRPFERMIQMTLEHAGAPRADSYRTEEAAPRPKGRTVTTSGRNVMFRD